MHIYLLHVHIWTHTYSSANNPLCFIVWYHLHGKPKNWSNWCLLKCKCLFSLEQKKPSSSFIFVYAGIPMQLIVQTKLFRPCIHYFTLVVLWNFRQRSSVSWQQSFDPCQYHNLATRVTFSEARNRMSLMIFRGFLLVELTCCYRNYINRNCPWTFMWFVNCSVLDKETYQLNFNYTRKWGSHIRS